MADVFLSYAPADAGFVIHIARALERAGLTAARAPQKPTPDWPVRLYEEIDRASAILALWSKSSLENEWTPMEAAVGLHFGQLISLRIDPDLDRDAIPASFRDPQSGEIADLFEKTVAPNGWNNEVEQGLDRIIAPLAGRVRQLKARGPFVQSPAGISAMPEADGVARLVRQQFTWLRHDGTEKKSARSLPALAAARREAAFRAAFSSLAGMEHPADIRTGLVELGDLNTARRGLARLYAHGLHHNHPEYWGHLARVAAPFSPSLCLASLHRSEASPDEIESHLDPRDWQELHAQRVGKRRLGRPTVVMWPIAAVALGLAAVVSAPTIGNQISRLSQSESTPKEEAAATANVPGANVEVAAAAPPSGRQPKLYNPKAFAAPPWAGEAPAEKTIEPTAPPKGSVTTQKVSAPPPSKTTIAIPTAPPPPPVQAPNANWSIGADLPNPQARQTQRLCSTQPGPAELSVEVWADEGIARVAERMGLVDRASIKRFIDRNASCLNGRKLVLSDGREISGANLIFPGDLLIVPSDATGVL
jgi:hypothetical protein